MAEVMRRDLKAQVIKVLQVLPVSGNTSCEDARAARREAHVGLTEACDQSWHQLAWPVSEPPWKRVPQPSSNHNLVRGLPGRSAPKVKPTATVRRDKGLWSQSFEVIFYTAILLMFNTNLP